jgi:hypothetical protein
MHVVGAYEQCEQALEVGHGVLSGLGGGGGAEESVPVSRVWVEGGRFRGGEHMRQKGRGGE